MTNEELKSKLDKATFDIVQLGSVLKTFEHYKQSLILILANYKIDRKYTKDDDLLETFKHTENMIESMIEHVELVFDNSLVDTILKEHGGEQIIKDALKIINQKNES